MIVGSANSLFLCFLVFFLVLQDRDFTASEGGSILGISSENKDTQKETYCVAVWNLYVFNSFALALPQGFSNLI